MANSLASTATLYPVEFAGATLFVADQDGKPFAPMKAIVEAMGLDWSAQHAKLKSNRGRWGMGEIAIPSAGGIQMMVCIALYKLAGWLTSISPNKIKDLVTRERVIKYQNECDTALWDYWNTGHAVRPMPYAVLPGQTLSAEQADTLRNMLTDACGELAKDLHGMFMREGWSKLKSHFKVGYREIPQSQFNEAVSLVTRHIVFYNGTKVVVAEPLKNALKALPAAQPTKTLQLMVITTEGGKSTVEMYPASDLPQMVMHMRDVFAAEEVLKIASHANLRMIGEVVRMGHDEEWEQFKKTARKLPAHRLNALAGDLWIELGSRTILGNELACA